jgi:hypothetical protein
MLPYDYKNDGDLTTWSMSIFVANYVPKGTTHSKHTPNGLTPKTNTNQKRLPPTPPTLILLPCRSIRVRTQSVAHLELLQLLNLLL